MVPIYPKHRSNRSTLILRAIVWWSCVLLCQNACAFDYFEHRAVGNVAFELALEKADADRKHEIVSVLKAITPADRRAAVGGERVHPVLFGDLVALAGDLAEDPKRLLELSLHWKNDADRLEAKVPSLDIRENSYFVTRQHLFSTCQWLYRTRSADLGDSIGHLDDCFDKLFFSPHKSKKALFAFGAEGFKPSIGELAAFEKLPGYAALAAENMDHFPKRSWRRYSVHHACAVGLSKYLLRKTYNVQSDKQVECEKIDLKALSRFDIIVRMILEEAFAQHFLHDSFASGHIGVYVLDCPSGRFCAQSKAVVKISHDTLNEIGIPLHFRDGAIPCFIQTVAPAPKEWTGFGDRHLFIPEADWHREIVRAASMQSLEEVLSPTRDQKCIVDPPSSFPLPPEELMAEPASADSDAPGLRGIRQFLDQQLLMRKTDSLVARPKSSLLFVASDDPRVPVLTREGWRVGLGYSLYGSSFVDGQQQSSRGGATARLEYLRSVGGIFVPNVYGIEGPFGSGNTQSYGVSIGWEWPRYVDSMSILVSASLRVANRIGNDRDQSFSIVFPSVGYRLELYPPVSLLLSLDLFARDLTRDQFESIFASGQNSLRVNAGFQLELSDVRR